MKRLLAPAIISAAALALAACGSDDGDSGSAAAANTESASTPESPATTSAGSTPTVSVTEIEELGPVLTDAEGRVLYVSDEEAADPEVVCTDACEEFWAPMEAGSEASTGASGVTGLDVFERPDGTMQVTHDGLRLYTFTLDDPGEATGEGLSDTFDGQRFTWHAVVVEETAPTGPAGSGVPEASTAATTSSEDTSGATTTPAAGDVYDDPGY